MMHFSGKMKTLIVANIIFTSFLTFTFGLTTEERAKFTGLQVSQSVSGNDFVIKSTGLPEHEHGDFPTDDNPNTIEMVNNTFTVPLNPAKVNGTPGCLPMGSIGVALNGIPLFNPYNMFGKNAVEGEYKEIFDMCNGHPSPDGAYHYHYSPICLNITEKDKLVGVALDGFPIYGPVRGDGKTMTTSSLDVCHGTTYNGTYRYYITSDFPYILGCYMGTAGKAETQQTNETTGQMPGGGPPPDGGMGPPPDGGMGPMEVQCYYAFDEEQGQTTFTVSGSTETKFLTSSILTWLFSWLLVYYY